MLVGLTVILIHLHRGDIMTKEIIKNMWRELKQEIDKRYGDEYPPKDDTYGWKLLGRIEALSWILEGCPTGPAFHKDSLTQKDE